MYTYVYMYIYIYEIVNCMIYRLLFWLIAIISDQFIPYDTILLDHFNIVCGSCVCVCIYVYVHVHIYIYIHI